jgi:hypothetical protein
MDSNGRGITILRVVHIHTVGRKIDKSVGSMGRMIFHLFGPLKKFLGVKWFPEDADVKQAVTSWADTWHRFVIFRTTSFSAMVRQILKRKCDHFEVWRVPSATYMPYINLTQISRHRNVCYLTLWKLYVCLVGCFFYLSPRDNWN